MGDFDGRVALVTGGASGIGAATAQLLMERGARVAVLDRSVEGAPAGALALPADVTDPARVAEAVGEAAQALGGLDVLVNNAGIGAVGDITEHDDAEWLRVFDVNVVGVARVTRAALPQLRRSDAAAVVNTCSTLAYIGVPRRALYSATKGAVHSLTLAMAADLVREGIRVNAVAPATTDTPWVQRNVEATPDPEATAAAMRARQPTGRLVSALEVAAAIAYLASPAAGSVTGTVLHVDGGMRGLRV